MITTNPQLGNGSKHDADDVDGDNEDDDDLGNADYFAASDRIEESSIARSLYATRGRHTPGSASIDANHNEGTGKQTETPTRPLGHDAVKVLVGQEQPVGGLEVPKRCAMQPLSHQWYEK